MKLEKEIKQKKFQNEYQKAMVNILFTASWVGTIHSKYLKPHGISLQQYNILRILRGQHPNPVTINLLIDRMLDKMSNASRLVDKLKHKGLVKRKESKNDRRRVDVLITVKGLDLLSRTDKYIRNLDKAFGAITKSEAQNLNRILDKLRG